MSISTQALQIFVGSVYAYCDFCQTMATTGKPTLPDRMMIVLDAAAVRHPDYPLYQIEPPTTIESVAAQLVNLGWKLETIHGKTMLICPKCAAK